MVTMWYAEAGKYNVLPIDSRGTQRIAEERPQIAVDRDRSIYYQGTQMVPVNAAPRVLNRPHSISVEVEIPEGKADGTLFSMGGTDGGFSLYVIDGVFTYGYNYVAESYFRVCASSALPTGHHVLSMDFRPTGPADVAAGKGTPAHITLFVDGAPVGEGDLPVTIPLSLGLTTGVAVGHDPGSPTMPDYQPPFAYPGRIRRALVDVSGTAVEDLEAQIRMVLARQ
jgi:hypothetical protein